MADEEPARIVVGVDGSAASARALEWALAQAEISGADVEAVTVWDISSGFGSGPTVLDGEDLGAEAARMLEQAVGAAQAEHPNATVTEIVRRGHPAAILLDQAADAALLVVGSHGHGGFAGALLGSVSQHCAQDATCPVVVVRAPH
ncbi:universal stress protein [Luedemannella flava]|uniref:Universal stress protein n=1 Tax=Luedemannella flava TaxID=349316 RepID=A0ABP4Y4W5_9ACTN